jgi:hypothetical protein
MNVAANFAQKFQLKDLENCDAQGFIQMCYDYEKSYYLLQTNYPTILDVNELFIVYYVIKENQEHSEGTAYQWIFKLSEVWYYCQVLTDENVVFKFGIEELKNGWESWVANHKKF